MRTTLKKLQSLLKLETGWHYGEGVPLSRSCVAVVKPLLVELEQRQATTDIFPGIGGEILLALYDREVYEDYTFEVDGTVTFSRDNGKELLAYQEGLSVEWAKRHILRRASETLNGAG